MTKQRKCDFKKREHFLILSKMSTKTNNHVLEALTLAKHLSIYSNSTSHVKNYINRRCETESFLI
jgi:hypothetical protein